VWFLGRHCDQSARPGVGLEAREPLVDRPVHDHPNAAAGMGVPGQPAIRRKDHLTHLELTDVQRFLAARAGEHRDSAHLRQLDVIEGGKEVRAARGELVCVGGAEFREQLAAAVDADLLEDGL